MSETLNCIMFVIVCCWDLYLINVYLLSTGAPNAY